MSSGPDEDNIRSSRRLGASLGVADSRAIRLLVMDDVNRVP